MPIDRTDWRRRFEMAMRPLSSSITASRYGMPPLDNAGYRGLVKHVEENPEAAWLLKEYLTRIHVDATDAIELIEAHPEVRDVFSGHGMDRATFVTMPGKGFRMGAETAGRLCSKDRSHSGQRRGCRRGRRVPDARR